MKFTPTLEKSFALNTKLSKKNYKTVIESQWQQSGDCNLQTLLCIYQVTLGI